MLEPLSGFAEFYLTPKLPGGLFRHLAFFDSGMELWSQLFLLESLPLVHGLLTGDLACLCGLADIFADRVNPAANGFGRRAIFSAVFFAVIFVLAVKSGKGFPFYFAHLPLGVFPGHFAFADGMLQAFPDSSEMRMDFFAVVRSAIALVAVLELCVDLLLYLAHFPVGVFLGHFTCPDRVLKLAPDFFDVRIDPGSLISTTGAVFIGFRLSCDCLPLGAGVLFAHLTARHGRLEPLANRLEIRPERIAMLSLAISVMPGSGRLFERAHHDVGLFLRDLTVLDSPLQPLVNGAVVPGGCDAKGKHDHRAQQDARLQQT